MELLLPSSPKVIAFLLHALENKLRNTANLCEWHIWTGHPRGTGLPIQHFLKSKYHLDIKYVYSQEIWGWKKCQYPQPGKPLPFWGLSHSWPSFVYLLFFSPTSSSWNWLTTFLIFNCPDQYPRSLIDLILYFKSVPSIYLMYLIPKPTMI